MFQVSLSLDFTCLWLDHLAEKYGGTVKLLQCVPRATRKGTSALAKISGLDCSPEEISKAVSELPPVEGATFTTIRPGTYMGIVTTRSCPCANTALAHSNLVQATVVGKDRMRWTLLLEHGDSLKELTGELREQGIDFKIEEVVKLRDMWRLTDRQEQVLRAALDLGFYDVPRRIGSKDLARLFDVSPRAISEVLRRAHKRIVSRILELPHDREL